MTSTSLASFVLPARNDPDGEFDGPPFSERTWRLSVLTLDAGFGCLVLLAALDTLLQDASQPASRPLGLIALAVLALGYGSFGRLALRGDADRAALTYLTIMVACVGVLGWAQPDGLFILFIVYPQVWFLVEKPRPGTVWTLLVFVASTVGVLLDITHAGQALFGAVSSQLVGLAFSLLIGIWTSQVLTQSRRQSVLIEQLERAQAQLAESHHAQGVLAERERLSHEVHDTLAQGYTSVVMLAQAATTALPDRPAVAVDRLAMIAEVARGNLQEARAFVAAFSPPDLDGRTLRQAMARVVERFGRETGLRVDAVLADDVAGLDRDQEVVLVRTAQEALSNARRHAWATTVSLRLSGCAGDVVLEVVDDGVGFEDGVGFDDAHAGGRGLAGLRRRVEQAGGSLIISSAPGAGTAITARLVRSS